MRSGYGDIMLKILLDKMSSWMADAPQSKKSSDSVFKLLYRSLTIGELRFDVATQEWVFTYSGEFAKQSNVAPLADFPNVEREYRSKSLWPFFALRVPSYEQAAVKELMAKEHCEKIDQVTMLRAFGRTSVSNPFDLVPA